jgi:hypothetical protein
MSKHEDGQARQLNNASLCNKNIVVCSNCLLLQSGRRFVCFFVAKEPLLVSLLPGLLIAHYRATTKPVQDLFPDENPVDFLHEDHSMVVAHAQYAVVRFVYNPFSVDSPANCSLRRGRDLCKILSLLTSLLTAHYAVVETCVKSFLCWHPCWLLTTRWSRLV